MPSYTLISGIAISRENPIAAVELAHACGADIDWVVQLVDVGIIQIETAAATPHDWVFGSADLQTALEARRLERDFGVALDVAALILDLQHEVRRLKGLLAAQGLRP